MKRFGLEFDQKSKQLIINWSKRTFMKKTTLELELILMMIYFE